MAENFPRKDFTPSEWVDMGRAIDALESAAAKERMSEGGRCGKLPHLDAGKTRDKVAVAFGTSGRTYEKAKAVVAAAEAEPERFGNLAPPETHWRVRPTVRPA